MRSAQQSWPASRPGDRPTWSSRQAESRDECLQRGKAPVARPTPQFPEDSPQLARHGWSHPRHKGQEESQAVRRARGSMAAVDGRPEHQLCPATAAAARCQAACRRAERAMDRRSTRSSTSRVTPSNINDRYTYTRTSDVVHTTKVGAARNITLGPRAPSSHAHQRGVSLLPYSVEDPHGPIPPTGAGPSRTRAAQPQTGMSPPHTLPRPHVSPGTTIPEVSALPT